MADAVSIARYLFDEASSGTTPTVAADDEGTHDLDDIEYDVADANWTSNAEGNGLDFLSTSGNAVAQTTEDMSSAGSLGDLLDGAKEVSIILACRIDAGDASQHRLVAFGTPSGNAELGIVVSPTEFDLRWAHESSFNYARYDHTGGTGNEVYGNHIFHWVIDADQAVAADRYRLWAEGSQKTLGSIVGSSGVALATLNAAMSLAVGNRPDGFRGMDSAVWYLEFFTGQLTTDEIADSYAALSSDHDANWAAAPAVPGPLMLTGML